MASERKPLRSYPVTVSVGDIRSEVIGVVHVMADTTPADVTNTLAEMFDQVAQAIRAGGQ